MHHDIHPPYSLLSPYCYAPGHGGETSFSATKAEDWVDPRTMDKYQPLLSDCAKGHVAYK